MEKKLVTNLGREKNINRDYLIELITSIHNKLLQKLLALSKNGFSFEESFTHNCYNIHDFIKKEFESKYNIILDLNIGNVEIGDTNLFNVNKENLYTNIFNGKYHAWLSYNDFIIDYTITNLLKYTYDRENFLRSLPNPILNPEIIVGTTENLLEEKRVYTTLEKNPNYPIIPILYL